MSCQVTYKGVKYSEAEFFSFLAAGEYDKLVAEGSFVPKKITLSTDAPAPAKGKIKERSLTKQFLKDNPSLQLSEGAINYEEISNKSTVEEVMNLIDELGLDASVYAVDDWKNGMNLRVRFTMAQILIKKLSKEGRLDEANDLRERLVVAATEAGQGIQAFAMFPALTAEGELRKMLKMINNINKKGRKQIRSLLR